MEWYWQEKTEVIEGKPVPVPLCPPQIPRGLSLLRSNNTNRSSIGPSHSSVSSHRGSTKSYLWATPCALPRRSSCNKPRLQLSIARRHEENPRITTASTVRMAQVGAVARLWDAGKLRTGKCLGLTTALYRPRIKRIEAKDKRRQTTYVWRNTEARSRKHCCYGNAIRITYPECVHVALVIQHARCMRHIIPRIIICGLSGCAIFFHIISYVWHDFGGKKLLNIKCVFWVSLQLLSETFLF
jgi:hypothetical protein